jgi:hypothetical protein
MLKLKMDINSHPCSIHVEAQLTTAAAPNRTMRGNSTKRRRESDSQGNQSTRARRPHESEGQGSQRTSTQRRNWRTFQAQARKDLEDQRQGEEDARIAQEEEAKIKKRVDEAAADIVSVV